MAAPVKRDRSSILTRSSVWGRAPAIAAWLLAAGAAMVAAVPPRLFQLRRELWLDEATQSVVMLRAQGVWGLRRTTALHAAPILDFALRKAFWIPLVGHDELGLRLPSLAYSLTTVVVVGVLAYRISRRRASPMWAALVALVACSWCSLQSQEVYYAAEARLYSFVSLLSIAWVPAFVFRDRTRPPWAFVTLACLFLQAHFFAFPLVAAAFLFEAVQALREGGRRRALAWVGALAVMTGVLIWLNWYALAVLFLLPSITAAPQYSSLGAQLAQGGRLFWEQQQTFELPSAPFAAWLAVALGLALALRGPGRAEATRLGLLYLVSIPMYVVFTASTHFFPARYSMPFYGIAFALLLSALEAVRALAALSSKSRVPTMLAGVAVALAFCQNAKRVTELPRSWRLPPRNFSARFAFFERLKSRSDSLFTVNIPSWGDVIPELYWRYLGGAAGGPLVSRPRLGTQELAGFTADSPTGRAVDEFLRTAPRPAVILNQVHARCAPLRPYPGVEIDRFEVEDRGLENCLWAVRSLTASSTLEEVGRVEGFPAAVPR